VKGPIAGDTSFRAYFTSSSFEPRATNLAMATASAPYPAGWFVLGVTPPITAPAVAPSGGSATNETRAYVYTFATQWGEESAPSPASSPATGHPDGTWAISNMDTAPPNSYAISSAVWSGGVLTLGVNSTFGLRSGEYVTTAGLAPAALNGSWKVASILDATHITIAVPNNPGTITTATGTATRNAPHNTTGMTKRLYRSVTSGSSPGYYFTKEIPVATTSTNDDVGANIGEPIPTVGWIMPPVDLQGVRVHPSGALVGFSGNELCFSEPLAPYAWPLAYRNTTDYPIVGIGVFGSSVVVATAGVPYLFQGVDPSTMSPTKVPQNWPCLSKRGIVESGDGVMWPAPQGLAYVGINGEDLMTMQFYTQAEWSLELPGTFCGAYHDNRYYAGNLIDADHGNVLIFDRADQATVSHSNWKIAGIYNDPKTGKLYILHNGAIKEWDADQSTRMPITWWSKEFILPVPINVSAAKLDADFTSTAGEQAALIAAQAAQQSANLAAISSRTTHGGFGKAAANKYSFNGSSVKPLSLVGDGGIRRAVFELYAGNDLKFSKTITTEKAFRLPSGFKTDRLSIRVISTVPINSILIGETMDDLRTA
jgi:hypothetical protein